MRGTVPLFMKEDVYLKRVPEGNTWTSRSQHLLGSNHEKMAHPNKSTRVELFVTDRRLIFISSLCHAYSDFCMIINDRYCTACTRVGSDSCSCVGVKQEPSSVVSHLLYLSLSIEALHICVSIKPWIRNNLIPIFFLLFCFSSFYCYYHCWRVLILLLHCGSFNFDDDVYFFRLIYNRFFNRFLICTK